MNSAVNCGRLFADVFHDVDLAAVGPADLVDVFAEHPERRPDSLPARNLDAGFETSIGLSEFALRFEAGRGVIARDAIRTCVLLLQSGDDEIPIALQRVLRARG